MKYAHTAVLAALLLTASSVHANTFPSSLNNWSPGDTIPSAWANALEQKIGTDNSATSTTLDYRVSTTTNKTATSTLKVGNNPYTTILGTTNATSTFQSGLDVLGGCIATNGTCIDLSGNVSLLGDLTDVSTSSPGYGDLLGWNGSDWTEFPTSTLAINASDLNLTAGTNITLSSNTLNVDDAFLVNDAADTGTGPYTFSAATGTTTVEHNTEVKGNASSTDVFVGELIHFGNGRCMGEDSSTSTPNVTIQACSSF